MEIVLHIGTDKTGSTAIQHAVFTNRDWLLAHGVFIPETGLGQDNGHALLLEKLDRDDLKALACELDAAQSQGYQFTLLSWEGMCRFNKSQIRSLARYLPNDTIRILIYIREQAEVIQSGHLQWIKMHDKAVKISTIATPANVIEQLTSYLFLRNPRRDYFRTLRKWQKSIPGASFSVRAFSKAELVSGDVIADFLHQFAISKDDKFESGAGVTNPSLDVEAALVIEEWKSNDTATEKIEGLIDQTQSVIAQNGISTKYFLDESTVNTVRRFFNRSNEKLARHFMGSQAHPFPDPSPCWRNENLTEVQARARLLRQKIEALAVTPTLVRTANGANIVRLVELPSGWSKPEDWGIWSTGTASVIRFRILSSRVFGKLDAIRLELRGGYYGENSVTGVTVNGIEFGERALSADCRDLVIPLSNLAPNEVVEIHLTHLNPVSPFSLVGKKDNRPLAFALQSVGYELVCMSSDK